MGLSILSYVKFLKGKDLEEFQTVIESIQDRLDWLDDREPMSNGETYDNWQTKRDETETLLEYLQALYDDLEEDPENFTQEVVEEIQELINEYQKYTGGLKRWF